MTTSTAKFDVGNVTVIIEHHDTSEITEERSASTVDLRLNATIASETRCLAENFHSQIKRRKYNVRHSLN